MARARTRGAGAADEAAAPEIDEEAPVVALYEVRSAGLPRPGGGAYGVGDRFEARTDSPAARSSFVVRVESDEPAPPAEVEAALDEAAGEGEGEGEGEGDADGAAGE